ncbi:MerR family transcriptional regulator [Rhodococcus koreensis]
MGTYRISQLAERSGVPATTLRFYEDIGLVPAERTAAGYRHYGEDAVDRLAFISSAKLLGLPLEEIRDLLAVWGRGECADVRTSMLPLITERIGDAHRRIAELTAFAAHLEHVRTGLSEQAPAGGCGPGCGCLVDPPADTTAHPSLPLLRLNDDSAGSWQQAPVVCTLSGAQLGERTEQWRQLVGRATARENIAGGKRLIFPSEPDLAAQLASLAAAEQDCCSFFDFTLHLTPAALTLDVRAPEAAAPLVDELFGATR